MPRTADFRVLASLDLDVLGCPDFGAALAHERKLVAARHALVAVRGGLIAVEVRCRETADQNDGVEHDRFISRVGQPTRQRHWFVVSSCSKVHHTPPRSSPAGSYPARKPCELWHTPIRTRRFHARRSQNSSHEAERLLKRKQKQVRTGSPRPVGVKSGSEAMSGAM